MPRQLGAGGILSTRDDGLWRRGRAAHGLHLERKQRPVRPLNVGQLPEVEVFREQTIRASYTATRRFPKTLDPGTLVRGLNAIGAWLFVWENYGLKIPRFVAVASVAILKRL